MPGFELGLWDYATFATSFLAGGAGILIYIGIAGLPVRIALMRYHPEAEALEPMDLAPHSCLRHCAYGHLLPDPATCPAR
jgi:hypothetical protein